MFYSAGYFACYYNEYEYTTIIAKQIKAKINRLKYNLALKQNALFNANLKN